MRVFPEATGMVASEVGVTTAYRALSAVKAHATKHCEDKCKNVHETQHSSRGVVSTSERVIIIFFFITNPILEIVKLRITETVACSGSSSSECHNRI